MLALLLAILVASTHAGLVRENKSPTSDQNVGPMLGSTAVNVSRHPAMSDDVAPVKALRQSRTRKRIKISAKEIEDTAHMVLEDVQQEKRKCKSGYFYSLSLKECRKCDANCTFKGDQCAEECVNHFKFKQQMEDLSSIHSTVYKNDKDTDAQLAQRDATLAVVIAIGGVVTFVFSAMFGCIIYCLIKLKNEVKRMKDRQTAPPEGDKDKKKSCQESQPDVLDKTSADKSRIALLNRKRDENQE